jgi:ABC-type cobalamin/Fe3+-siderophores transport system ATPase subunit
MELDVTIKNYRCFPDSRPARFSLRPGFTALVGTNNSGKSSVLKLFYELRELFRGVGNLGELVASLRGQPRAFSWKVRDPSEFFSNSNDRDLILELRVLGEGQSPGLERVRQITVQVPRNTNTWTASMEFADDTNVDWSSVGIEGSSTLSGGGLDIDLTSFQELCRQATEALYVPAFRNVVNVGTNETYYDIQIGQAFIDAWREFKTGASKANNEAALGITEDIRRIFGFSTFEINAAADSTTLQLFIDGRSFGLPEVGGGLAHFILVLVNMAIRRPTFLLIDEPELNLHPSLQLDFLTTASSYASEGCVISTHSVGLARASAERVYSVQRVGPGESELTRFEATANLAEFLGELSFLGYKELGFDSVLLVEGPTEVKTFQQFLKLYGKDHEIVLLPMGGAQTIGPNAEYELSEVLRITKNVSAIIDSERSAPGKPLDTSRQRFVDACTKLNIRCHVLERRATENYFTDRAVKQVFGGQFSELAPFENLKDAAQPWAKRKNRQVASAITRDELEATDLGAFISQL